MNPRQWRATALENTRCIERFRQRTFAETPRQVSKRCSCETTLLPCFKCLTTWCCRAEAASFTRLPLPQTTAQNKKTFPFPFLTRCLPQIARRNTSWSGGFWPRTCAATPFWKFKRSRSPTATSPTSLSSLPTKPTAATRIPCSKMRWPTTTVPPTKSPQALTPCSKVATTTTIWSARSLSQTPAEISQKPPKPCPFATTLHPPF